MGLWPGIALRTTRAFGPEPHGAWNRNRRCTLAIPPQTGQNVTAWGNAPGTATRKQEPQRGETNRIAPRCFAPLGLFDRVAPQTQADAHGYHLEGLCPGTAWSMGLWPGTSWCVESQSALHSCDSAPNGAKCDSLGQRPRKRQPHKNQSPNGAEPTVLHRVVPPRWGFSIVWPRKPRAMPWAFTLWAFFPESRW